MSTVLPTLRDETFASLVMAFSDRFLSQRSFDLVVAPALADLEFESGNNRAAIQAARVAVIRAMAGALGVDMRRGSGGFFKLALLSYCYFMFPIALGVTYFETWGDFAVAASFVLMMSLVPVMVCFWPSRQSVRPHE